ATITLLGLSAESHYVKPLLDRIGVEVEPFARKEYKTAAERVSRDSMSEYQREQLQALIDGHTDALLDALAQRIGTTPAQVRTLFEVGVFRGQGAIDARLADGLAYEDELPEKLGVRGGHLRVGRADGPTCFRRGGAPSCAPGPTCARRVALGRLTRRFR
ncbi:MAG: S49 family peptidase, partial [Deltaproteobacteria bacterium]|nr:S49 family peptidase [Deltaproteobacteria bacterium]